MLFLIAFLNRNIIFDFDDAIYIKETFKEKPSTIGYGSRKAVRRLIYSLSKAKTVITGNKHLREFVLTHNKNIRVVPTVIDMEEYNLRQRRNEKSVYLGWIGIGDNQYYLENLRSVLTIIEKKYPEVTLKVISDKPFKSRDIKVENVKWDIKNYKRELVELDIGLMPLNDDEWSRGKCAFKLIHYMAAGLPVIASNVGSNSTVITDGEDGYLVNSKDEWLTAFENLIESKELRRKMGRAAKKKIRESFSAEAWIDRYESILSDEEG